MYLENDSFSSQSKSLETIESDGLQCLWESLLYVRIAWNWPRTELWA